MNYEYKSYLSERIGTKLDYYIIYIRVYMIMCQGGEGVKNRTFWRGADFIKGPKWDILRQRTSNQALC